jgi:hypothetical protein
VSARPVRPPRMTATLDDLIAAVAVVVAVAGTVVVRPVIPPG